MKKFIPQIVIVVLLVVAVVLGYMIYSTITGKNIISTNLLSVNPSTSGKSELDQVKNVVRWSKLAPGEKTRLLAIVNKLAQSSDTLTVSKNCEVSPYILKISINSTLKIENTDIIGHTLGMFDKQVLLGKKQTISVGFKTFTTGAYRYSCDDKLSGYLVLTP